MMNQPFHSPAEQAVDAASGPAGQPALSFRPDGTFTIVQFTDLHWKTGGEEDQRTRRLMEAVIAAEQPDLVMYTGDVIYTGPVKPGDPECADPGQAFRDAVSAAESAGIPWAFTFGNHDTEGAISRETLMSIALEHRHTVARRGPLDIHGVGNYRLNIASPGSDAPAAALYVLDSGEYSPIPEVGGYNWIRRDQIDWYVSQSRAAEQAAAEADVSPVPALAFFHIPLPEYRQVWETRDCYGHKHEDVCCARVNSGLFAAMVECGDVIGTFCGHDHINDYWGELHGIRLCYGRASGYNTYGREGFPRGARVIRLQHSERRFDTWLRLDGGEVVREQPLHRPDSPAK